MELKWMTAGESHGPGLAGILTGLPAGLDVSIDYINDELARRQRGFGRSQRQQIENDTVKFIAGIRHEKTIGSPIAVMIENLDHQNWLDVMDPGNADKINLDEYYDSRLFLPRPGHADLAGILKWGFPDARNVAERASGRSTAATVALGALCKQYLRRFGIYIGSRINAYGPEWLADEASLPMTRAEIGDNAESLLTMGNLNFEEVERIQKIIEESRQAGDTLGGEIEVVAAQIPPGLGSCMSPGLRLDSRIAGAVMSVPGIKAVQIGAGIDQASSTGKNIHDLFARTTDPFHRPWFGRTSNFGGGIEGGITNGEPVCFTAWMKPLSTVVPSFETLDPETGKPETPEFSERSDVCAVEAVMVVLESVLALELTGAHREKFGGDTITEVDKAVENYMNSIDRI